MGYHKPCNTLQVNHVGGLFSCNEGVAQIIVEWHEQIEFLLLIMNELQGSNLDYMHMSNLPYICSESINTNGQGNSVGYLCCGTTHAIFLKQRDNCGLCSVNEGTVQNVKECSSPICSTWSLGGEGL